MTFIRNSHGWHSEMMPTLNNFNLSHLIIIFFVFGSSNFVVTCFSINIQKASSYYLKNYINRHITHIRNTIDGSQQWHVYCYAAWSFHHIPEYYTSQSIFSDTSNFVAHPIEWPEFLQNQYGRFCFYQMISFTRGILCT